MHILLFFRGVLAHLYDKSPAFYPAAFGAVIAYVSLKNQRKTSREKNSLDFEAAYKRNAEVVEAWSVLLKVHKNRLNFPIENYGKQENSQSDEAKALKMIFNEWERCANAVRHNLYDERYLYNVYGSTLIFLDVHFEPYMAECRKTNSRFYKNMKNLSLKWRVRRSYEDKDGESRDYLKKLKVAQKAINDLPVKP